MNFCSINYSSLPPELCTLLLELQTLAKIPFSCWFFHKILLSRARGSWSVHQTREKRMSILFYEENQHYGKKYPVCLNLILRCPLIFHELGVVIPTKKFLLPFGTALSGAWASCSCCLIRKIKVWRGWRGKNWEKTWSLPVLEGKFLQFVPFPCPCVSWKWKGRARNWYPNKNSGIYHKGLGSAGPGPSVWVSALFLMEL